MIDFLVVTVPVPFHLLLGSRVSVPWCVPQNKGCGPWTALGSPRFRNNDSNLWIPPARGSGCCTHTQSFALPPQWQVEGAWCSNYQPFRKAPWMGGSWSGGCRRREGKRRLCLQGRSSWGLLSDGRGGEASSAPLFSHALCLFPPLCRIIWNEEAQQKGNCGAVVPGVAVIYFPQLLLWKPGVDRAVL